MEGSERVYEDKDAARNLERILKIELPAVICLGQTTMMLRDLLKLGLGSIIELGVTADDPVSLMVNNHVIARGEVVVVDGNYGIKITEIESAAERIRRLGNANA